MKFITYKQYVEYLRTNDKLQVKEDKETYNFSAYDEKLLKEVDKRHDKMFKTILSIKKEMASFLNEYMKLEEKLNEDDIIECKTDFITKQYKDRKSDIIYKLKKRPIYFLVEHQSRVRKDMAYRVWEYIGEIMRREVILQKTYLKENNIYPIVVPIVIYTGHQKWNAKTNFKEMQYKSIKYEKYKLDLEYNLITIQDYTFQELIEKKNLFASIMMIEKCNTAKEIENITNKIIEIIEEKEEKEILVEIINQIIGPIVGKEKMDEMLEKLYGKEEHGMSPVTKLFFEVIGIYIIFSNF